MPDDAWRESYLNRCITPGVSSCVRVIVIVLLAACAPSPTDARELAALAAAWRETHPGQPAPPSCPTRAGSHRDDDGELVVDPDPIDVVDADLDPAPGVEHVVYDGRYGIAMFDARGELLATRDVACDWASSSWLNARSLVVGARRDLVLNRDASSIVLARDGARLVAAFELVTWVDDAYSWLREDAASSDVREFGYQTSRDRSGTCTLQRGPGFALASSDPECVAFVRWPHDAVTRPGPCR